MGLHLFSRGAKLNSLLEKVAKIVDPVMRELLVNYGKKAHGLQLSIFSRILTKVIRVLKNLAKRFACEGYWSAFAGPSIVFTSSVILGLPLTWDFLLITYVGGYALMLYNRYEELERDLLTNPARSRYIKKYLAILPTVIITLLLLVLLTPLLLGRFLGLTFIFFFIFLGLLYTKFLKRHVKLLAFKDVYVAFMWSLLPLLAMIYYFIPLTITFFLLFLFFFSRLFVNISFFDIKDIESDRREDVLTLPVVLGIEKTIKILWILSILSLLPLAIGVILQVFSPWILTFFLVLPYTYYFLKQGLIKGSKEDVFLYYFIVDGEVVFLWPLLSLPYLFLR